MTGLAQVIDQHVDSGLMQQNTFMSDPGSVHNHLGQESKGGRFGVPQS